MASVVYGLGPPLSPEFEAKLCAGAPGSPQNTWFHTPLPQLVMSLLRTKNCCCEPLVMGLELAMKPPLAQSGDRVHSVAVRRPQPGRPARRRPRSSRQPATLIVRLETERQKLSVA